MASEWALSAAVAAMCLRCVRPAASAMTPAGARLTKPRRAELAASININHAPWTWPAGRPEPAVVIGRRPERRRSQNSAIVATFPAGTFSSAPPLYHWRAGSAARAAYLRRVGRR